MIRYRITPDRYEGHEVQQRPWWRPWWTVSRGIHGPVNTFPAIKDALAHIDWLKWSRANSNSRPVLADTCVWG